MSSNVFSSLYRLSTLSIALICSLNYCCGTHQNNDNGESDYRDDDTFY